jgi:hypothetical protein
MPVKLPTPRNGWRVFAGEVGVIVLGVVIALAAQQAVEALNWREEVRRTEEALIIEIADSVVHASERQMVNRCLSGRLASLIGKVSSNQGSWKGDPMPINKSPRAVATVSAAPYRTPNRPWSSNVWEAAQNGGVFNHMRRERVAAFSKVYARLEGLRKVNEAEHQVFPNLLFLSFDTQLDAGTRQQALAGLGKLDWLNGTILLDGKMLIAEVRALRLDFSRTSLKRDLAERERNQRSLRGECVEPFMVKL